jgi:hypothetical protein
VAPALVGDDERMCLTAVSARDQQAREHCENAHVVIACVWPQGTPERLVNASSTSSADLSQDARK